MKPDNSYKKRGMFRMVAVKSYHYLEDYLLLRKKRKQGKIRYLNVGGGKFVRKNWGVLDFSNNPKSVEFKLTDFNIDLMSDKKWKIPNNKFSLAYCSHTIEHLSNKEVINLFREVFRILKKGSTFRIVVPDINLALYHYKNKNLNWFKICYGKFAHLPKDEKYALEHYFLTFFATELREKVDLEKIKRDFWDLKKEEFLEKYKAEYDYEHSNYHINWFDEKKLKSFLEGVGFMNIKKSSFKQSKEVEFCHNEFDGTIPQMSLFIECEKPYK